jgi:hypothetical protein
MDLPQIIPSNDEEKMKVIKVRGGLEFDEQLAVEFVNSNDTSKDRDFQSVLNNISPEHLQTLFNITFSSDPIGAVVLSGCSYKLPTNLSNFTITLNTTSLTTTGLDATKKVAIQYNYKNTGVTVYPTWTSSNNNSGSIVCDQSCNDLVGYSFFVTQVNDDPAVDKVITVNVTQGIAYQLSQYLQSLLFYDGLGKYYATLTDNEPYKPKMLRIQEELQANNMKKFEQNNKLQEEFDKEMTQYTTVELPRKLGGLNRANQQTENMNMLLKHMTNTKKD